MLATSWRRTLLRLTAVCCILAVILSAQYTVLSAYWYSLHFPNGSGPVLLSVNPLLAWSALLVGGIIGIIWWAERDERRELPASFSGAGLLLVLFATVTVIGTYETAGQSGDSRPQLILTSSYWWVVGLRMPAIELSNGQCAAYLNSILLGGGYLLFTIGLWLNPGMDTRITELVTHVTTMLQEREIG